MEQDILLLDFSGGFSYLKVVTEHAFERRS